MRQKINMPVSNNSCCAIGPGGDGCTSTSMFHLLTGNHQYTGASYCSWAHAVEDGGVDLAGLLEQLILPGSETISCSCCAKRALYHFYRAEKQDPETLTYFASFCRPEHFALYEDRVIADLRAVGKETR